MVEEDMGDAGIKDVHTSEILKAEIPADSVENNKKNISGTINDNLKPKMEVETRKYLEDGKLTVMSDGLPTTNISCMRKSAQIFKWH